MPPPRPVRLRPGWRTCLPRRVVCGNVINVLTPTRLPSAAEDPILTLFRENQRQFREFLKGLQVSSGLCEGLQGPR